MDSIENLVPPQNRQVYAYLYIIETALRELIIEKLEEVGGQQWYKRRLPGDVWEKYQRGRDVERRVAWTRVVLHHPIYYVDFPDLKKIIEQADNWRDAFAGVFGRKDISSSTLSELEVTRNKIAHNRKAMDEDIALARAALAKLSAAIGVDYFAALSARCTATQSIPQQFIQLADEAGRLYATCTTYAPVSSSSMI